MPALKSIFRYLSFGPRTSISEEHPTHISKLSNGIRVASVNSPGYHAALGVYIDGGSRYEESGDVKGATYLLDRLAFHGTKGRSSSQIRDIIHDLGENVHCNGQREVLALQAAIHPKDLEPALDLFADIVQNFQINSVDLDRQRTVGEYEIMDFYSDPKKYLPEIFHKIAYNCSTLGNLLLCSQDDLEKIQVDVIMKYYHRWYQPAHIVVAAIGYEHEKVLECANNKFGNMTPSSAAPMLVDREKALYVGGLNVRPNKNLEFTHLHIGFEGLPMTNDDIYPLAALHMLLGGGGSFSAGGPGKGMYSRLYKRVLNRYHYIESCESFHYPYSDSGLFGIALSAPHDNVKNLLTIAKEQLEYLSREAGRENAITEVEVARAKNQLKSALLMNLESRMLDLEDLGRQVQVQNKRTSAVEVLSKVEAITLEDVIRVARSVIFGSRPTMLIEGNPPESLDLRSFLK